MARLAIVGLGSGLALVGLTLHSASAWAQPEEAAAGETEVAPEGSEDVAADDDSEGAANAPEDKSEASDVEASDAEASDAEASEVEASEAATERSASSDAETDSRGEPEEPGDGELPPKHIAREHRPGGFDYRLPKDKRWAPLVWEGGRVFGQTEIDVGYAAYKYPERNDRPRETLHDIRGRFVLGPMFRHQFGGQYFISVFGQLVAWIREQGRNAYQINVDDVYAQVGHGTDWDFQVGRFMTWRVYHKGLGYDLYTLEDNGANKEYPISNDNFAAHTYEVDYIYLRNSPYVDGEVAGRAAFHYYPFDSLGFELAGAYGLAGNESTNTLGVRLATDFQWEFLRLSAATEYRDQVQTGPPNSLQNANTPEEQWVECAKCGASSHFGFGGSMVLKFGPVEGAGSFARGIRKGYRGVADDALGNVTEDPTKGSTRLSFGGYLEFDAGSLLFDRSLILGAGLNRTEDILDNHDQEFHRQTAAYVAFPLGINNAMVKLVFSQAEADLFDATNDEGTEFLDFHPNSKAVRFRFSSDF